MKNKLIKTALFLSVLVNVFLIFRQIHINTGGGKIESSPDGQLVATAMTLRNNNPFSSREIRGVFTVRSQSNQHQIVSFVLEPTVQTHDMGYRGPAQVVWARDSSNVTFHVPEGEFTININQYMSRQ